LGWAPLLFSRRTTMRSCALLLVLLGSAFSVGKNEICAGCEGCIVGEGNTWRCTCPTGKQLAADGKTCEIKRDTCEDAECKNKCDGGLKFQVEFGGKAFTTKLPDSLGDGGVAQIPCSQFKDYHAGKVSVQCFKGTLLADASKCEPECRVDPEWKRVSPCSVTCGTGTAEYRRKVIQRPGNNQPSCPPLMKTEPCWEKSCPIDCQVTEWRNTSGCSASSGYGLQTQIRNITVMNKFGGAPCPSTVRVVPCCVEGRQCIPGEWKEVQQCNATSLCGAGTEYQYGKRIRERIWTGKNCPEPEREVIDCEMECPPVHCEPGEWVDVTECSTTCGEGTLRQRLEIKVWPKNGGRQCPSRDRTQPCYLRDCPETQCAAVHRDAECKGPASPRAYLFGEQAPDSPANCRITMPGEKDVAKIILNCSRTCEKMYGECESFNWFEREKKCCFLSHRDQNDVHSIETNKDSMCYEGIQSGDSWSSKRQYGSRNRRSSRDWSGMDCPNCGRDRRSFGGDRGEDYEYNELEEEGMRLMAYAVLMSIACIIGFNYCFSRDLSSLSTPISVEQKDDGVDNLNNSGYSYRHKADFPVDRTPM